MSLPHRPSKIPTVNVGQPITAKHYNQMVTAINQLMDAIAKPADARQAVKLVELAENLTAYDRDTSGKTCLYDDSVTVGSDPITSFDGTSDEGLLCEISGQVHLAGERVPVFWNGPGGRQLVLPQGMNWHIGKLDGALDAGGSTTASIWWYNSSTSADADTTENETVYDWMMDEDGSENQSLPAGTKVIVAQHPATRRFYVVAAYPPKMYAEVKLAAALSTSDATVSGTLVKQYGYGEDHASTSITLNNLPTATSGTYTFSGSLNDHGLAIYTGDGTIWDLWQLSC